MSNLPPDLRYAKTHEWAKLENINIVSVGITDHAQQELGDLVFVELPEVGRNARAGEECAVVESVKAASDLYSPVSGEVVEFNQTVIDKPELINEDAFAAWLFRIKVKDTKDFDNLEDADGYQSLIEG